MFRGYQLISSEDLITIYIFEDFTRTFSLISLTGTFHPMPALLSVRSQIFSSLTRDIG